MLIAIGVAATRHSCRAAFAALRNGIQVNPGTVIAGVAGVIDVPLLDAAESDRQPVDADTYLSSPTSEPLHDRYSRPFNTTGRRAPIRPAR